ncbi:ABC transporter substrate-binding protein [Pseudonocardia alaniniphila]|uniref:ABC transporter substrate-binding protein n=1 Tax=Pseudonocardia alaniniphila TaxID=75291 RepID=A0ABS9TAH0_9PSEU|nr:ABC transporter substrate-binding protein [Pseudonocardia alaniniphila]MCH6165528.1 ABC transporter substrate-binding protein [Pseudonocardia alaniniphila]
MRTDHRTRRRLAVTVLAILVTALSAACSSSTAPASGPAPGPSALAQAGPVTVTLWYGLGGAAGKALQDAVAGFNAHNADHITVQAVFQGDYDDTLAKYTSAIRDGNTPDMLLSNDVSTGFIHDAGQTVSAQDLAAANPGELNLRDLRPAARNYYTADGKLLSAPFNTSMPMLYVNDSLLARAGVDTSTLTTMTGLDAAARKIHSAIPGVAGFAEPQGDGWWFEQMTAAAGAEYCTPDNGRTGAGATAFSLNNPEQRASLETITGLYTDGVALDTGSDDDALTQAFIAGKVAMMFNSSGVIGDLTTGGLTGYTALPIPVSGPARQAGAIIGGASLWVSGPGHDAAHQAASWKAISYLDSPPVQEQFSHASGYAPINVKVDQSPTQQQFLAQHPAWGAVMQEFNHTPASPATAGCLSGALPRIRQAMITSLYRAFGGTTPFDGAVSQAQSTGTNIIKDYREQAGQ